MSICCYIQTIQVYMRLLQYYRNLYSTVFYTRGIQSTASHVGGIVQLLLNNCVGCLQAIRTFHVSSLRHQKTLEEEESCIFILPQLPRRK